MEEIIAEVLETSTEEVENPDIRDRGYIYWRLLSEYPDETKEIVLSDKPTLKSNKIIFGQTLLENLVDNIGMISGVFH
jgi:vesicle coat complex subunit